MTFNDQSLYSPQFSTHYIQYTLYDLAEWINGMSFKQSMFSERGVPVIKIAEVKNGITQQTKYSDADHDLKYLLKDDDYLFCWSGQPETSIDTFKWNSGAGWLNQHIYKVLPRENIINAEYFYYLMKYLKPTFIKLASNKQTTGLGHVTKKDLQEIQVAIPEQTKQSAITNTLKNVDKKIKLLEETNQTLESIAKAIFKSWFVDFDPVHAKQQGIECAGIDKATADLFPNSFVESELGLIPKDWKVGLLGDKIKIAYGKNLPTNKLLDVGYDVFGGNGKIGYFDQYIYETRQVLIACRGAASGAINQSTPKAFITNNSLILETNQNSLLTFSYIKGFMKRADLSPFVTGSAQPQVTIENIKMFKLLIPPKAVIDAYEDIVKIFEDKIQSNIYCINSFTGIRNTLLPRLISGKLDLSNIEEQLEGVA